MASFCAMFVLMEIMWLAKLLIVSYQFRKFDIPLGKKCDAIPISPLLRQAVGRSEGRSEIGIGIVSVDAARDQR